MSSPARWCVCSFRELCVILMQIRLPYRGALLITNQSKLDLSKETFSHLLPVWHDKFWWSSPSEKFEIKADVDMHVEIKFKRNKIYCNMGKVYSDALDELLHTDRPFHIFFFFVSRKKIMRAPLKIQFSIFNFTILKLFKRICYFFSSIKLETHEKF